MTTQEIGPQVSKDQEQTSPAVTEELARELSGVASTPSEDTPVSITDAPLEHQLEMVERFANETHKYIREFIRFADQKAGIVFAASAALLGFSYGRGDAARWLKPLSSWSLHDGLIFVAMASLLAACIMAFLVVAPRLSGGARPGLIFWDSITTYSGPRDYASAVRSTGGEELVNARLQHCYDLAVISKRKYLMLRLALWIGAVGLTSLVVHLFFG